MPASQDATEGFYLSSYVLINIDRYNLEEMREIRYQIYKGFTPNPRFRGCTRNLVKMNLIIFLKSDVL